VITATISRCLSINTRTNIHEYMQTDSWPTSIPPLTSFLTSTRVSPIGLNPPRREDVRSHCTWDKQTEHSSTVCSRATPAVLKSGQISETHAHIFRGIQLSTIKYPVKYSSFLCYVTSQGNVPAIERNDETRTPWCSYCLLLATQLGQCCLGGTVKLEWRTTISNKRTYIFI
jgi:hypothetical protein